MEMATCRRACTLTVQAYSLVEMAMCSHTCTAIKC